MTLTTGATRRAPAVGDSCLPGRGGPGREGHWNDARTVYTDPGSVQRKTRRPSLSVNPPVTMRIRSTSHQIPRPPNVSNSRIPVPILPTKSGKIAAEVPAAIRSKGTLTIAADATYAPNEFVQPGSSKIVGMDADLANAIGQVLGLRPRVSSQNR